MKNNAKEAYHKAHDETEQLLKALRDNLHTHACEWAFDDQNWKFVGDITHINKQLKDLVEFLQFDKDKE